MGLPPVDQQDWTDLIGDLVARFEHVPEPENRRA
jgi:hypothetical protein